MPNDPLPLSAGSIAHQIGIVLAIVLVNGFFVASEFALVRVRRTRIDQLAAEGSAAAAVVQRALRHINLFIAATQIGVTLASLILGSTGEKVFEPLFVAFFTYIGLPISIIGLPRLAISAAFAFFVMTTMHVVIGELVPKSLALHKTETVAMIIAPPMTWFARLASPLVWMLTGLSGLIIRALGMPRVVDSHSGVHSAEELDLLFTQSHEGGELSTTEREILHRVVRFSDTTAREIMVPRVEMEGIPASVTRAQLTSLIHGKPHTRIPVYRESMDDLVGVVHLKDLVPFVAALEPGLADNTVDLAPIVRETARVPETLAIDKLLGVFKKRREQMAIVIDEYGGTAGLITMGDLLQQVFGEVRDEFDEAGPVAPARGDGRVQLAGRVLIDEVNERFGTGFRSDDADTVAGLVLAALGRPAVVGDEVAINGASLRVEAIERLRITSLSLLPPPGHSAEAENADSG